VPRRTRIAIAAIIGAVALLAIGAYGGDDDNATRYFLIASAIAIAVAIVVFWVILPRITRPGLWALIFGILAAASVAVFWLGLPTIFGPAAIVLGLGGRERGVESGMATVGLALGALAVVAHIVLAFAG
jgi:hypothetical protein